MTKITLDKNMFKALASKTRLDILKNLDGKRLNLKEISNVTNLNKATLHEHLFKLHKAGLVKKKEREGHKWVYYKLTWKGNSLLHPENNRIIVMFSATFITLFIGIISIINYLNYYFSYTRGSNLLFTSKSEQLNDSFYMVGKETVFNGYNPFLLYVTICFLTIFIILMTLSIWRYRKNKKPQL